MQQLKVTTRTPPCHLIRELSRLEMVAMATVIRLGPSLAGVVCLAASAATAEPRSIASFVEEAYQKNPELHFYEQEIAAARGDRRTAGTSPNPDLSGQIGGK